jgi:hypothetical protein
VRKDSDRSTIHKSEEEDEPGEDGCLNIRTNSACLLWLFVCLHKRQELLFGAFSIMNVAVSCDTAVGSSSRLSRFESSSSIGGSQP